MVQCVRAHQQPATALWCHSWQSAWRRRRWTGRCLLWAGARVVSRWGNAVVTMTQHHLSRSTSPSVASTLHLWPMHVHQHHQWH